MDEPKTQPAGAGGAAGCMFLRVVRLNPFVVQHDSMTCVPGFHQASIRLP